MKQNLFFSNKDPKYLIKFLNQEIPKFSEWFTVNKLILNVDKTKFILFKPRQKRLSTHIQVKTNNKELSRSKKLSF